MTRLVIQAGVGVLAICLSQSGLHTPAIVLAMVNAIVSVSFRWEL